jgi:hypothetical protein
MPKPNRTSGTHTLANTDGYRLDQSRHRCQNLRAYIDLFLWQHVLLQAERVVCISIKLELETSKMVKTILVKLQKDQMVYLRAQILQAYIPVSGLVDKLHGHRLIIQTGLNYFIAKLEIIFDLDL